jgi:acyl-CoA reductase-like NAD-dependent aldehyde dehydrogenase
MQTIKSINPFSNEVIKEFESFNKEEIDLAIQNAKKAQISWSKLSTKERFKLFDKLKDVLTENIDSIAKVVLEEAGKLRPDFEAEIYDVIDGIDYYKAKYEQIKTDKSFNLNPVAFPDTATEIRYEPFGVIALIMPWNFPFYSPMMFVITSLITGNAVLLKPSEYTTMVGFEIERVLKAAGFPDNIIQIIPGGEETGRALVQSNVDKIFFVGSVEAGKDIMANAGIKPLQFELGGNSAAIVLEDADLDLAVSGIVWGATYHSGQDCVGIKRVVVVKEIADEFIKKIVQKVNALRAAVDYGPYITKEARDEVKKRIDHAVSNGAELLTGGHEPIEPDLFNGNWLLPSVVVIKNEEVELIQKETFGNVIPIIIVKNEAEAIKKVNDTKYGLSNAIFTKDTERAKRVEEQLESGMVFINDPFVAFPGWDHWTGWKESGFGTTESKLIQCLKKKVVSVNKGGKGRSFWYPY